VDDVSSSQIEPPAHDRRSWIAAIRRRNERLQSLGRRRRSSKCNARHGAREVPGRSGGEVRRPGSWLPPGVDGVMSVDALESLPPEDWPVALACFHRALASDGWSLYLTVELSNEERASGSTTRSATPAFRSSKGDWAESDGYYHSYPPMERVRSWIADADFAIVDESEASGTTRATRATVLAELTKSG
jgi:hypothetical protein